MPNLNQLFNPENQNGNNQQTLPRIFRIPNYQRGYSWGEKQLEQFWQDLEAHMHGAGQQSQYTGVITLEKIRQQDAHNRLPNDNGAVLISNGTREGFFIVDGQQRLTTILIFLSRIASALRTHQQINANDAADRIVSSFLYIHNPNPTPLFSYAYDNFNLLQNSLIDYIFTNQGQPPAGRYSIYMKNLESAATFFSQKLQGKNILNLINYENHLRNNIIFQEYHLENEWETFVIFECLNYRGKQLSLLELLKNRLLYLSTLVAQNNINLPQTINNAWSTVYTELGKLPQGDQLDHDFLTDHWIMRSTRKRGKAGAMESDLLDGEFRVGGNTQFHESNINDPENFLEHLTTNAVQGVNQTLLDIINEHAPDNSDDELEERFLAPLIANALNVLLQTPEPLVIGNSTYHSIIEKRNGLVVCYNGFLGHRQMDYATIQEYCASISSSVKCWVAIQSPNDADLNILLQHQEIKNWLWQIQLQGAASDTRPFLMAMLLKLDSDPTNLENCRELYRQLDRYLFVSGTLTDTRGSAVRDFLHRKSNEIYKANRNNIKYIFQRISNELRCCLKSSNDILANFILKLNRPSFWGKDNGINHPAGFYKLKGIQYLLWRYEEKLRFNAHNDPAPNCDLQNVLKRTRNASKREKSIEHIFPQNPVIAEWLPFQNLDPEILQRLKHSLGNLVLVSSDRNSALSNRSWLNKRNGIPGDNPVIRFSDGSKSEIEVASENPNDWSPTTILRRGIKLLEFVEITWNVLLGNRRKKAEILGLESLLNGMTDIEIENLLNLNDAPLHDFDENNYPGTFLSKHIVPQFGENNMLSNYLRQNDINNVNDLIRIYTTDYNVPGGITGIQYEEVVLAVLSNDNTRMETLFPRDIRFIIQQNLTLRSNPDRDLNIIRLDIVGESDNRIAVSTNQTVATVRNVKGQFWNFIKDLIDRDDLAYEWEQLLRVLPNRIPLTRENHNPHISDLVNGVLIKSRADGMFGDINMQ